MEQKTVRTIIICTTVLLLVLISSVLDVTLLEIKL